MFQSQFRHVWVVLILGTCASSRGAITYIDAVPDSGSGGNTTLNGTLFDATNLVNGVNASNATIQADNKWYYRTPSSTTNAGFAPNGGAFFETDGTSTEENADPLLTTITVPAPGIYNLYAMFIANTGSSAYGDIAVEVNNSGNSQFFFHRSSTVPTMAPFDQPGTWSDTSLAGTTFAETSSQFPVATQWTATSYHMYLANLGQFDLADTTVTFRITGPDAKKVSDGLATFTRTLYEGVAYELAPPPPLPGDFDNDHDVDGVDFAAWQSHFPVATNALTADGDADGDGDVDGADFIVWQTHFSSGSGITAVPEPASACLISAGLLGFLAAPLYRKLRKANGERRGSSKF